MSPIFWYTLAVQCKLIWSSFLNDYKHIDQVQALINLPIYLQL